MFTIRPVAALDHAGQHRAREPQPALEVDLDHAVPERLVGLDERPHLVPARVVDEDLDRAELVLHLAHRRGRPSPSPPRRSSTAMPPSPTGSASRMSPIATVCPARASASAIARPMPRLPPLTNATLPMAQRLTLACFLRCPGMPDRGGDGGEVLAQLPEVHLADQPAQLLSSRRG